MLSVAFLFVSFSVTRAYPNVPRTSILPGSPLGLLTSHFFASFHFLTLLTTICASQRIGLFWCFSTGLDSFFLGEVIFPHMDFIVYYILVVYIIYWWRLGQCSSLGAASLICAIQILPQVSSVFVTTKSLTLQFQQDNEIVAMHSFLLISFLQRQICFSFTYRQKEFQLKQQLIGFGALINVNLLSEIAGSPWGSILKDIGCAEAWVL